ncbi:MAG: hypothetical protein IJN02_05635 [Bacteroidales bacterium]|nr:hypothetical protein [Bacteroidales bacterium]
MAKGTKRFLSSIIAALFFIHGIDAYAADKKENLSQIEALIESSKETKGVNVEKIEGFTLKLAKPFMKKTPMAAIMNDLDRMIMFSMEDTSAQDDSLFVDKAEKILKDYFKITETRKDDSLTSIYIDISPEENTFSEMVMYITKPGIALMIFKGSFTLESLKKMGELSQQMEEKENTMESK